MTGWDNLTCDGGNETASKAKFFILCSCKRDLWAFMARFRISSFCSGVRSSDDILSSCTSSWPDASCCETVVGLISETLEAKRTACCSKLGLWFEDCRGLSGRAEPRGASGDTLISQGHRLVISSCVNGLDILLGA